jgi:hypothetical protein
MKKVQLILIVMFMTTSMISLAQTKDKNPFL